jgi:biofilm PGA synthesis N-glycosyltransferase PgaC
MISDCLRYGLVTPARNEQKFIEAAIRSVVSQTVRPTKWVIVSDGSTDGTDEIVQSYLPSYPWIELVRMPDRLERHFAAKVECFNAGYARLPSTGIDIVGNLDADITFDADYLEFLLTKFAADPQLGVAGTPFIEGAQSYDFRFTTAGHVSGACQLFRKECFVQVGGYAPVRGGGIDWIAVTTARMKGWKTRTFTDRSCYHHRPMGTATNGLLRAYFKLGKQDYYLGGHPLWQIFRGCYQMTRKPRIVGGALLVLGYWWAWITRAQRPITQELMKFHRHEQMRRLREYLAGWFKHRGTA